MKNWWNEIFYIFQLNSTELHTSTSLKQLNELIRDDKDYAYENLWWFFWASLVCLFWDNEQRTWETLLIDFSYIKVESEVKERNFLANKFFFSLYYYWKLRETFFLSTYKGNSLIKKNMSWASNFSFLSLSYFFVSHFEIYKFLHICLPDFSTFLLLHHSLSNTSKTLLKCVMSSLHLIAEKKMHTKIY